MCLARHAIVCIAFKRNGSRHGQLGLHAQLGNWVPAWHVLSWRCAAHTVQLPGPQRAQQAEGAKEEGQDEEEEACPLEQQRELPASASRDKDRLVSHFGFGCEPDLLQCYADAAGCWMCESCACGAAYLGPDFSNRPKPLYAMHMQHAWRGYSAPL